MSNDKKWTRRAAVGFLAAGAGLFATETTGFTQVQGDRNVSLDTRPDPNGLVGFAPEDDDGAVSGCPGDRIELFNLVNNFGGDDSEPMSVNGIEITNASGNLEPEELEEFEYPDEIASDSDTGRVTGRLSEEADAGSGQISFEISVSHDGVSTILDRTVDLTINGEVTKAFTETGTQTWNVPSGINTVDVLVVGGGGGGAANTQYNSAGGGGGGAGGAVFAADYDIPEGGDVDLAVGGGGNGRDRPAPVSGENGESSTFDELTAKGGGGGNLTGGSGDQSASDGGSGGGGRQNPPGEATQLGTNSSVSRAVDLGNDGGRNSTDNGGGGGGGAGQEPNDINDSDGGAGGNGVAQAEADGETYVFAEVFGTEYGEANGGAVYFAGGGGGGGDGNGVSGTGGLGGGGKGASDRDGTVAEDGKDNTGGGGGGGASGPQGEPGGDGGSGIVLVRYNTCSSDPEDTNGVSDRYSDAESGNAEQPGEAASGVVIAPENIFDPDQDDTSTLQGDGGLKIGFRLPVEAADCYTLIINRDQGDVTGNLDASLVTAEGDKLVGPLDVKQSEEFDFTDEEATDISNSEEVYLIFEDNNNGKVTQKIKYIQLRGTNCGNDE